MKNYPQIYPNLKDWPIYQFSTKREEIISELDSKVLNKFQSKSTGELKQILLQTTFHEQQRINREPWKVDPPNEKLFWKKVNERLNNVEHLEDDDKRSQYLHYIEVIINRYSQEIVGGFKIKTFKFMRKFLTWLFHRLLNAARSRNLSGIFTNKHQLYEKLIVRGIEIDKIRELSKKGTLVVVPTHFSNLDSILVGYAIDSVLGLPAFLYSAGLNLFNYGIPAYFMNRLGAYRLDRRKKNPIYLETLKKFSQLALEKGIHTLFFAGGTRSRSGEMEQKLKLGLLSTTVSAQRQMLVKKYDNKIFIVPCVISYNFVLESKELIHQHLRDIGKEKYGGNQSSKLSIGSFLIFVWRLFKKDSEIVLSFGRPMDVLGNPVDVNGNSLDATGNKLDLKAYFKLDGRINEDLQRESVYTKRLSDHILKSFKEHNIVLSSHLLAYSYFGILAKKFDHLDFFEVLKLEPEETRITKKDLSNGIKPIRNVLLEMQKNKEILLEDSISQGVGECIDHGLNNIGIYHNKKPIKMDRKGYLYSEDMRLLYYYRNRLSSYSIQERLLETHQQSNL
jgi:glycerol-3-phosphate O-acyltransferase